MSGFMQRMEQEPQTDEEALQYVMHPFTTEYQDFYKMLRGKGISIRTALLATLEMRQYQLEQILQEQQS